ncbi:MAG TPA: MFS transporter, partial [Actinomycetes bacterium]|nr:MFS transporter [Actinomycetes bacterium]
MGNNITTLAVPWFVLVTTGSPVRTGLTGAAMGDRVGPGVGAGRATGGFGPLRPDTGPCRSAEDADRAGAADRAIAHLAHISL